MIVNKSVTLAREPRDEHNYFELKIGRQVVASGVFPKDTTDGRALVRLLDSIPRS